MSHSTHFNYSCDKCGKQFYGKKNLALHMKTHYTEDEKKHVCNVCGYRFAKIKFLKNHLTTHSDVRQYACEVSKYFFQIFVWNEINLLFSNCSPSLFSLSKHSFCFRSVELE